MPSLKSLPIAGRPQKLWRGLDELHAPAAPSRELGPDFPPTTAPRAGRCCSFSARRRRWPRWAAASSSPTRRSSPTRGSPRRSPRAIRCTTPRRACWTDAPPVFSSPRTRGGPPRSKAIPSTLPAGARSVRWSRPRSCASTIRSGSRWCSTATSPRPGATSSGTPRPRPRSCATGRAGPALPHAARLVAAHRPSAAAAPGRVPAGEVLLLERDSAPADPRRLAARLRRSVRHAAGLSRRPRWCSPSTPTCSRRCPARSLRCASGPTSATPPGARWRGSTRWRRISPSRE